VQRVTAVGKSRKGTVRLGSTLSIRYLIKHRFD
jgi:hypothetical protein